MCSGNTPNSSLGNLSNRLEPPEIIMKETDSQGASSSSGKMKMKRSRELCDRCHRVRPRACLCPALPVQKHPLQDSRVVILQHPHEFQHKTNRSVPLLDLCVSPLDLCVGRRLGDLIPGHIQSLLQPPHLPILIFPPLPEEQQHDSDQNYCSSLTELQEKISHWKEQTCKTPSETKPTTSNDDHDNDDVTPKIVLLALDATWKYAKEMHRANLRGGHYPSHMLRLSLRQEDMPRDFQPRRFELRTTPTNVPQAESWMSTAECLAWILSRIEEDHPQSSESIYSSTIRIIDAAVAQQRSFRNMDNSKHNNRNKKHKTGEHTPDTAK